MKTDVPSKHIREEKLVNWSDLSELLKGDLVKKLDAIVVVKADLEPVLKSIMDDAREHDGNIPFNLWMFDGDSRIVDVIPWNKSMSIGSCSCCGKAMKVLTYHWYLEVSCGEERSAEQCQDNGHCKLDHANCSRVHGNASLLVLKQHVAFDILKSIVHHGACIINVIPDVIMNDSIYMITKWMIWEGRLGILVKNGKENQRSSSYIAYDKEMENDEDVKRVIDESIVDGFIPVI